MHPHVTLIRDALSSAKALNETLELVKTASQRRQAASPVASVDSAIPSQTSPPAEAAEKSVSQEDPDHAPAMSAASMAPSEESPLSRGEVLSQVDEHIIEAPPESDAELEGLDTPLAALASRENIVVEAERMVSDASTMTAPHLLLTSLLKSKDVVWTSVPLGSEKNSQWSLMPALKHGHEDFHGISMLERGFKRMDALLEASAVPLPSKVLAGRAPGTLWPSISPWAWSSVGGGLELARITSEPPLGSASAAAFGALRGACGALPRPRAERWGGHGTSCAEALDLQPTTSSVRFSEWRSSSREVARMSKRRARSAHGQSESKDGDEPGEPRLAEVLVTQVPQVSAVTERRRMRAEREGDDQLVQQWLARLREPLPAVSKFEGQEPRHATSLVSVASEFQESCRRYSHESAPEVFIYFDDNSTEPDSRPSRPSTARTFSRPSSATPNPRRPWTGRRPLPMSKVASTRDEEPEEAPSEANDAVTEDTWQLPRAPAFVPRVPPMRRIKAPSQSGHSGPSRPRSSKRPRPATAERKVHRAYVCHRPASAA